MILDGKRAATHIEERIASTIKKVHKRPPGLAFVLVGDHPASRIYIEVKRKKCAAVGIRSFDCELSAHCTETQLLEEIESLNRNPEIDGVLVQLPLPTHLSAHRILSAIDPEKDVDGFHPMNLGKLLLGEPDGFIPGTPFGIQLLLTHYQIPILGKRVVIVGRSNIVGKPLAALLMQKAPHCNATVTVAHSATEDLSGVCQSADILVAALGRPRFIAPEMIKRGAVVIDVGINRVQDDKGKQHIVGDVDFDAVSPMTSHITPVPGGVGPMTVAALLSNTLLSYERHIYTHGN